MATKLSVPEQHQFKIAKSTLKMSDVGAMIMGGMSKDEARRFLREKAGWSDEKLALFENPPKNHTDLGRIVLNKMGEERVRKAYQLDNVDDLHEIGRLALGFRDINPDGTMN